MARKRKAAPAATAAATESSEPPKKQQHQEQEQELEKQRQEQELQRRAQLVEQQQEQEEEEAEEYEQVVEEVEEEVEVEEEEEEEDDDEEENNNNEEDEEEDDDPVEKLLEPFGKEQLINLLREAADTHGDVADRIRAIADGDPAHRKIFVHGLGWDTTAETLTNAFKQYGEIEDCKAVCDKVSGKSKGYGFILFKKRSGARRALKEPQKKIGNRMTACQLASIGPVPVGQAATASSAPSGASSQQQMQVSEYTKRKIYVSNVGADLDPQELTSFFAKFGEIEEGPLGLDKVTGKPKGFCLYVYKSVESAKKALEEPHKNFQGHTLHCQRAIDGPKHSKSQHQQHQQHYNSQKSHYQRNGNPSYSGGAASGPAHLMAPAAGPAIGYTDGGAGASALNPALGQALTALLATQGAGLGLNLLGTLGSAAGAVPGAASGMQGAYVNQSGSYGNQGVMHGTYPNQQAGQTSSGRGQHGGGQYGGVGHYMGH